MSLFHVIKYQVSCPPTVQEVMALPTEIIDEWVNNLITITGETAEEKAIHRKRRVNDCINYVKENRLGSVQLLTNILRRLITEYDDLDENIHNV